MGTQPYSRPASRRPSAQRVAVRRAVFLTACLGVLALVVGLAYSGSSSTIAEGQTVAGVDVGGLTTSEAVALLESEASAIAKTPVTFTAGGATFRYSASQLGVEENWRGAVEAARAEGDGFAPVRGLRRIHLRVFGGETTPTVTAYNAAVAYVLDRIANRVDRAHVEPQLRLAGLKVETVPGVNGIELDRDAAAEVIVRSLASLERGVPVPLPVLTTQPEATVEDLAPAAERTRVALSAPVRLTSGETTWRLPRWRIAGILELPSGGSTEVGVGGTGATRYLSRLARTVDRAPRDATFRVVSGGITVVDAIPGRELDRTRTIAGLERAVFSPDRRTTTLVVATAQPERTTAEAKAMGINEVVGSYTTTYGGAPERLHNVSLVAELIDGTLIAPGTVFSFNATTGERNAERGFQEAPVIINGELQNGIGGGVCQVSTTVFNAAFEAGLSIEERVNHALYISHYPTGRDATVNYPDLDLKFKNDTEAWLLLRTFVGAGALTVNLYGTSPDRRVETELAPLEVAGPIPVEKTDDPTMVKGKRVVDEVGQPPRDTSIRRIVYDADGELLYDTVWSSHYVGEPSLVRVGTKPKPEPETKPKKPKTPVEQGTTPTPTVEAPAVQ